MTNATTPDSRSPQPMQPQKFPANSDLEGFSTKAEDAEQAHPTDTSDSAATDPTLSTNTSDETCTEKQFGDKEATKSVLRPLTDSLKDYENTTEFITTSAPQEAIRAFLDDEINVEDSCSEENNAGIQQPKNTSSESRQEPESAPAEAAPEPTGLKPECEPETDSDQSESAPKPASSLSDSASDSDSDSGLDSDADDADSLPADAVLEEEDAVSGPIVSKNELAEEKASTLPADYHVPENAPLEYVGTIIALVEQSAIISASTSGELRVLKENSVLCFEDRLVLGPLFEVFGRLQSPKYRVKFNTEEEFHQISDKKGEKVYYVVPESQFVYTAALKKIKGTDASNCHDEELPEEEQDFSDDERELAAKQAKSKRKQGAADKGTQFGSGVFGPSTKKHAPSPGPASFITYEVTNQAAASAPPSVAAIRATIDIPVPRNPPAVVLGTRGTLNYSSEPAAPVAAQMDAQVPYVGTYRAPYQALGHNYQNYGQYAQNAPSNTFMQPGWNQLPYAFQQNQQSQPPSQPNSQPPKNQQLPNQLQNPHLQNRHQPNAHLQNEQLPQNVHQNLQFVHCPPYQQFQHRFQPFLPQPFQQQQTQQQQYLMQQYASRGQSSQTNYAVPAPVPVPANPAQPPQTQPTPQPPNNAALKQLQQLVASNLGQGKE